MTTKTKAPVREGVSKAKAPVREGLAFLIEDALERSEVVIAAEGIIEKLQKMAEELSTVEAKDIMPLLDALTNAFGPEVAQNFNNIATEQVRQLITSVQAAKTAMDNEIIRLKHGVEGGEVSDMSMDAGAAPMMPGAAPDAGAPEPGMEGPPSPDGLSDVPPDMSGNAEDDAMGAGAGNFAGREKKMGESRRSRGKRVAEDVMPGQSHESTNYSGNLNNLAAFHGGAGRLAQSIGNMIRSEELSLEQRKALANVLSHIAAYSADPSHWSGIDADAKLKMNLQAAGLWKIDSPVVEKVVAQLKRLVHLLSLHHDSMLESNISMLRKATNPDAIILNMFRTKLRENQDGQMAAIRTARAFAIDVEDVVAVVREAAARRPFRKLTEFKAPDDKKDKPDDKKSGKFGGKQAKPFGKKEVDECDEPDVKKSGKFGGKQAKPFGRKEVDEDAPPLMQGVPMFPIDQNSAASSLVSNPMNANPMSGDGQDDDQMQQQQDMQQPSNQSNSTNKPLSPGDMRARQNAQQQQTAVTNQMQNIASQGQNGQPNGQKPSGTGQNAQPNGQKPSGTGQPKPQTQQNTTPGQPFQPPGKVMKSSDPALKRRSMQN